MKLLQALTLIPALLILSLRIESANAKPSTKTYRDGLTVVLLDLRKRAIAALRK